MMSQRGDKKGWIWAVLPLVIAASIGGCSLKQDPYADNPTAQKGIPPELDKEPPQPKPVREDALRIDALDIYPFRVGIEGQITITGRVLMPIDGHDPVLNKDFEISITNLNDFEGAEFDPQTGVFKWTPRKLEDQSGYGENRRLEVQLTTKSSPILGTTKLITLFVTRSEVDPQIVSVEDMTAAPFTREGEIRKFKVVVQDPDSLDIDGARPRLMAFRNSNTNKIDVAGLIYPVETTWPTKNPVQDPTDKTRWTFTMMLDLRGREVTKNKEDFTFGLEAVSRFGKKGIANSKITLVTSVQDPVMSWGSVINAVAGQENTINFTVFDPQGESKLMVSFGSLSFRCDMLPGAATCTCQDQQGLDGSQLCTIRWKIPDNPPRTDYWIEGEVLAQTKVANDPAFKKISFSKKVKILPNPNPAPVPVPPKTSNEVM